MQCKGDPCSTYSNDYRGIQGTKIDVYNTAGYFAGLPMAHDKDTHSTYITERETQHSADYRGGDI